MCLALAMILIGLILCYLESYSAVLIKEEKKASTLNVWFWEERQWIIQYFSRTAVTEFSDYVTCIQSLAKHLGVLLIPGNNRALY